MPFPKPVEVVKTDNFSIWRQKTNQLSAEVGNVDDLLTPIKTDLVSAVNSVVRESGSDIELFSSTGKIILSSNNVEKWEVETAGHFIPTVDNAYDIGSPTFRVRNLYVDNLVGSLTTLANDTFIFARNFANSADEGLLKLDVNDDTIVNSPNDLFFYSNDTARWFVEAASGNLIAQTADIGITTNTSDGADNRTIYLAGGGTNAASRGAFLQLYGNEASSGSVSLYSGNAAASVIRLRNNSATGTIRFENASGNGWLFDANTASLYPTTGGYSMGISANRVALFSSSIDNSGTSTLAADVILTATDNTIRTNTADASDNKSVAIAGGGAASDGRGATIALFGAEYPSLGGQIRYSADVSHIFRCGGTVKLTLNTSGNLEFANSSFVFGADTTDGSDNRRLNLASGGDVGSTRGGWIQLSGNEQASTPGRVYIESGAVSGGHVNLNVGSASNNFVVLLGGSSVYTVSNTQHLFTLQAVTSSSLAGNIRLDGKYGSITANSNVFQKLVQFEGYDCPITATFTDTGYRVGLGIEHYFATAAFAGTLAEQKGIWCRNGANSALPTGTISNSYGLDLEHMEAANVIHTNQPYGVYQRSSSGTMGIANLRNYFEGRVGIGIANPTSDTALDVAGLTQIQGNIRFTQTSSEIYTNSVDGSDTKSIKIIGGGAAASTRGAILQVYGNEASGGVAGNAYVDSGNTGNIFLRSFHSTEPTINCSGDIILNNPLSITSQIKLDTTDGTDDNALYLIGAGYTSGNIRARAASVQIYGNEATGAEGQLILSSGEAPGASVRIQSYNTLFAEAITFEVDGTNRWSITKDGYLLPGSSNAYQIGAIGAQVSEVHSKEVIINRASGDSETLAGLLFHVDDVFKGGLKIIDSDSSLQVYADQDLYFATNFANRWSIAAAGHLRVETNNTYDIGSTGTRVRNVYADTHVANQFTSENSANESCASLKNTNASFTDTVVNLITDKNNASDFSFITCFSNDAVLPDLEFRVRGDGVVSGDGAYSSPAADYAEYFESSNGLALSIGCTVVLDGVTGKIREYDSNQDDTTDIFGVIRPKMHTCSVVGNFPLYWQDKYLRDDFGAYIRDQSGNLQINPEYDPELEYVSREDRAEWNIVGLMGQIPVLSSAAKNPSWKKLKDISQTVELYLVK